MATWRQRMEQMIKGEVPVAPVTELIGFRLVAVGDGTAVFEMDTDERHANPMGTLHGGVLCDIADAAMATAFCTTLNEGDSLTTLELKINFLKPVWKTHLRAEAKVIKAGQTVGLASCDITDSQGSLVAHATSTCMALRGDKASGR
jgi:uncharacterized protein (TIGR00369 family)